MNTTEDRPIRPAATIIMLREIEEVGDCRFEAAMIERHQDMAFAAGATVFPGGAIDPADSDGAWKDLSDGLHADPVLARGQVASIREAFEETGILLARHYDEDTFIAAEAVEVLQEWRPKVEADGHQFIEMVRDHKLRLTCDRLVLFSHWIAPQQLKKRFDTLFFVVRAPLDQKLIQDGVEATSATWISPPKALSEAEEGKRHIIFPTARNLELLGVKKTVQETLEWAETRKIEPITPGGEFRDGKLYLTLPDGFGYPKLAFLAKESVNR